MSAFKDVERLPYSTDNATRLSLDFRAAKLKDQCISSGKKSYDKDEKDKNNGTKLGNLLSWKPFKRGLSYGDKRCLVSRIFYTNFLQSSHHISMKAVLN